MNGNIILVMCIVLLAVIMTGCDVANYNVRRNSPAEFKVIYNASWTSGGGTSMNIVYTVRDGKIVDCAGEYVYTASIDWSTGKSQYGRNLCDLSWFDKGTFPGSDAPLVLKYNPNNATGKFISESGSQKWEVVLNQ
jgi:hypothetical protein